MLLLGLMKLMSKINVGIAQQVRTAKIISMMEKG